MPITKWNCTYANQSDASLMPAPLNPTDMHSTRNYQRKRKNNHAIDVSGVAVLKDTSRLNTQKQLLEEDLDEENENEHNSHAESTTNDFESLKLSTINHNESTRGGRNTRSSKTFAQPQKILPSNKRSRSPLATHNSINESTDQSVLSSTRIEPKVMRLNKRGAAGKNSIATRALDYVNNRQYDVDSSDDEVQQNNNLSEIEQDSTAIEFQPSSKRNRRSEENENEISVP